MAFINLQLSPTGGGDNFQVPPTDGGDLRLANITNGYKHLASYHEQMAVLHNLQISPPDVAHSHKITYTLHLHQDTVIR